MDLPFKLINPSDGHVQGEVRTSKIVITIIAATIIVEWAPKFCRIVTVEAGCSAADVHDSA